MGVKVVSGNYRVFKVKACPFDEVEFYIGNKAENRDWVVIQKAISESKDKANSAFAQFQEYTENKVLRWRVIIKKNKSFSYCCLVERNSFFVQSGASNKVNLEEYREKWLLDSI